MDEEKAEKSQLNEPEKPLDLVLAEWKAYLKWGYAAAPRGSPLDQETGFVIQSNE